MIEAVTNWDLNVLLRIQQSLRADFLTPIMRFVTHLGDYGILWVAFCVILLIPKRTRRAALFAGISLGITFLITNVILKPTVMRVRPYEYSSQVLLLIRRPGDYSFPSGHTAAAFAVSLYLLRALPKRAGIPPVVFASLIAFSRLYVGVHYPTDVIASFLIALVISQVMYLMSGRKKVQ